MDALRTSIADHTRERAEALPDWPSTAVRLRSEHRGILERLRANDRDGAAERIQAHIRGYYRETSLSAPAPEG